ncbi:hypothetical protein [Thermoactinospora rubra]|uniref:hypothetical protein n=1 Tax=Thermoactinospora rubra TaxID=1088767 RepID=UPI000A104C73|nr:hypothetical protein [Thermoactinospora rubra]
MTTRGRYSGQPTPPVPPAGVVRVRVVGAPDDVTAYIARAAFAGVVVSQSKAFPRRDEPGQVAIHLKVRVSGDA